MSDNKKDNRPSNTEKPKEPDVVIQNSAGTYSGPNLEVAVAKAVGDRK